MKRQNRRKLKRNDFRRWLDSLQKYIKQINPTQLDLSEKSFGSGQLKSILNVVADSEISELALKGIDDKNVDLSVLQLLPRTKVRKLNIARCRISEETLMGFVSILKDTQITHLDLSHYSVDLPYYLQHLGKSSSFNLDYFKSCLQMSKVVLLHICEFAVTSHELLKCLPQFVTCLSMSHYPDGLCKSLSNDIFSYIGALANLTIRVSDLTEEDIGVLARNLVNSKLEKLSFEYCYMGDARLKILTEGLIHSSVSIFSLIGCQGPTMSNLVPCFQLPHLKELHLTNSCIDFDPSGMILFSQNIMGSSLGTLNLRGCSLGDEAGQLLMKSLKSSKLSCLDVQSNEFGLPTILELAQVISNTNLVNLELGSNKLSDQALVVLQSCVKTSQLKHLNLCWNSFKDIDTVNTFLETVSSYLESIDIGGNPVQFFPGKGPSLGVKNSNLTHLDLFGIELVGVIVDLTENLKLSAITHLKLGRTGITDENAEILATCLEDTQVVNLDLSANSITGVKAIPPCVNRTKLIHIDLSWNKIENDGLQLIADRIENTFITSLDLTQYPKKRDFIIDSVLWRNRIRSQELIKFFKKIAPQTCGNINFDHGLQNETLVTEFLAECLQFYKTISEQPAAVSILTEEGSISFSKTEIVSILFDEFPTQFAAYIGTRIEAHVAAHVEFLKEVEDMGLTKIVETLLLNRPNYSIDEENGILHPYVYKLLLKYKLPICNLGVEPEGITKITVFFNNHSELDGATELVTMLSNIDLNQNRS